MKQYFLTVFFLMIMLNLLAVEVVPIAERGNLAEKIWMESGVNKMLDNLRLDIPSSEADFSTFRRVYSLQILGDQIDFFSAAINDEQFLMSDSKSNYLDWLNSKQIYYRKEYRYFLDNKDSVLKNFLKASMNNMLMDDGCDTTAGCNNMGFEDGDFGNWTRYLGKACDDATYGDRYYHLYNYIPDYFTTNRIKIVSSGYDALVGGTILPKVCPGGAFSLKLEDDSVGGLSSRIERILKVNSGQGMFYYKYAVVLEDPGSTHPDSTKPFFRVRVLKMDGSCTDTGEIECAKYVVVANSSNPELQNNFTLVRGTSYYYKKWTTVGIPLSDYIGQTIKIEFTVSDCSKGGHLGYAYIDGQCLSMPDPIISSCDSGKRALTAPLGFSKYKWTGPGITCCNNQSYTLVDEPGTYYLKATTVSGCEHTYTLSVDSCMKPDSNCTIDDLELDSAVCNDSTNMFDLTGTLTFPFAPKKGVLIVSNGYLSQLYNLPLSSPFVFKFKNLMSDGKGHTVTASFYNSNFISPAYLSCQYSENYVSPEPCYSPEIGCPDCLTSFNPEPGRYIVSAWVKQMGALPDIATYNKPFIQIKFSNGTTTLSKMYASGKIVDQWQRIFYEFSIPNGATNISIDLGTDSGAALIDDIRIHPANGSFVSYVYDPVSLKLVATLDDNNYATIYEYDNEGTLLRVKKETERGVMTIKESRENSPKR